MIGFVAATVVASTLAGLEPGSYALAVRLEGTRSVPLLGTVETKTESWSHVDLVEHPRSVGSFIATETACAIESDGGLFVARAQPTLLARLVPWSWVLRVSPAGTVIADRGTYALGFRIAPGAAGAALPTRSDDPRVTDPDGDGRPGAAMNVDVRGFGTLHLQVASTWQTVLTGQVSGAGAEGALRAVTRERILSGLPLPGQLAPVQLRAERSRFRLAPLPKGASGCAAVATLRGRGG